MILGKKGHWVLIAGLMFSASAISDIEVETESLHLRFSEQGDLLRAEACFPDCSADDGLHRVLSAGQGMLLFGQGEFQTGQAKREHVNSTTILSFPDQSGQAQTIWQIPDQGWLISVTSTRAESATLASGEAFRPAASSGFGYLLEQSRYLVFNGSSVETIGLDADKQTSRSSNGWFGFRNRFWAAMVLSTSPLSIEAATGEALEDASMKMTSSEPGFELSIYLGPIEPKALSQTATELEGLMYSGLWFWLRWVCQALYFMLNVIFMAIPHWGLALMTLAVVVGVLMRPLSNFADRMQDQVHAIDARLAPTLAHIKKNYKGAGQSEKILKMYKDENVHPLYSLKSLMGVLVVIPVFIGAFNMLAENIHLSAQSFLWIADLSQADSFIQLPFSIPFFGGYLNLLPFIMTGLSIIASKLHSHPDMDAAAQRKQARNLLIMSLGFLILFYTFPAGMVLYWTTNNLISVIKTLWKRRKVST